MEKSSSHTVIPITESPTTPAYKNDKDKLAMRNTILLSVAFGVCFFGM